MVTSSQILFYMVFIHSLDTFYDMARSVIKFVERNSRFCKVWAGLSSSGCLYVVLSIPSGINSTHLNASDSQSAFVYIVGGCSCLLISMQWRVDYSCSMVAAGNLN